MTERATAINLVDGRQLILAGEPILDTEEGVLIVAFDDGTSRTFNWIHILDYYYMTNDEYSQLKQGSGRSL